MKADDVRRDAAWRFTPIGVLAHVERDALNLAQLVEFARFFNLPVIRWRLELVAGDALTDAEREELYANEPNLWGYFVAGAPALMSETIKSTRKLVNGTPCLLDSLDAASDADRQRLAAAYAKGFEHTQGGEVVYCELAEMPAAVNVIAGGTAAAPRYWHEMQLDDLSSLIPGCDPSAQLVALLPSSNAEEVDCYSFYTAQQGLAQKIDVRGHQYMLAFALTDYKLQGRTLNKLILSVPKRSRLPWMDLSAFYVLVSRVRELNGLRLLQVDQEGLDAVAALRPDDYLHAWEQGYGDDGFWSDARAAAALTALRERRKAAREAKAKAEAEAWRAAQAERHAGQKRKAPTASKAPAARKPTQCSLCGSTAHIKGKKCPSFAAWKATHCG